MPGALLEAFAEQGLRAIEVHEPDVRPSHAEPAAVAALQCGAGEHDAATLGDRGVDQPSEPIEPRAAFLVVERNAAPHERDVLRRMEVVSVVKLLAEAAGQQATDHRFAASGNAHDDDDVGLR